jgi:hypothetical protein
MARSADPFQAAITATLKPFMRKHGLRPLGSRVFARLSGEVLQFVYLDKRLHGSPNFDIGVNAFPTFIGRDSLAWSPPGFALGVFSAPSHDAASEQMQRAVTVIEERGVPWLSATGTVEKLEAQLHSCKADPWESVMFMRACCLARLGSVEKAQGVLAELQVKALRDWVSKPGSKAVLLSDAIHTGTHMELLNLWSDASHRALKLQRIE